MIYYITILVCPSLILIASWIDVLLDIFIRELENIRIDCSTLHLVEKRVDYVITYRLIRDIIRNNDHIEVHALDGLLV